MNIFNYVDNQYFASYNLVFLLSFKRYFEVEGIILRLFFPLIMAFFLMSQAFQPIVGRAENSADNLR